MECFCNLQINKKYNLSLLFLLCLSVYMYAFMHVGNHENSANPKKEVQGWGVGGGEVFTECSTVTPIWFKTSELDFQIDGQ